MRCCRPLQAMDILGRKKTESIQKQTYGEQDWYYSGSCY